jgi:hypothetical protein
MIPDPRPHLFTLNAKSNNAYILGDLSLVRPFPTVNGVHCTFIPRISGVLISKSLPAESDFLYGYLPRLSVIFDYFFLPNRNSSPSELQIPPHDWGSFES